MSDYVIDASALLAVLNQEPNTDRWAKAIEIASISAVNLSEVVAKLADAGLNEAEIREALGNLGLEVVTFETESAFQAGLLRVQTKALGLSLGDRACLALGRRLKLPILTADRTWTRLRVGVEIQVIR